MENSSLIDVMIADDVSDLEDVQTEIREAVARVTDLPAEVTETPTVTEIKTALMPVIEVGMTSEALAYADYENMPVGWKKIKKCSRSCQS